MGRYTDEAKARRLKVEFSESIYIYLQYMRNINELDSKPEAENNHGFTAESEEGQRQNKTLIFEEDNCSMLQTN